MEKYRYTFNAFVPLNQLQICTLLNYQILYALKFELILNCKPSSESTSFFLVHFSYQVCLPCSLYFSVKSFFILKSSENTTQYEFLIRIER